MNWTMIGAVGEVIGALGVIITLAYLAKQVGANTRQLRLAAERDIYQANREHLLLLAQDRDLATLWRSGMADPSGLDSVQRLQLRAFLLDLTLDWQRTHDFAEAGELGSRIAEATRRWRWDVMAAPAYREFFEARKHLLADDFREVIEREIASVAAATSVPDGTGDVRTVDSLGHPQQSGPPDSSRGR